MAKKKTQEKPREIKSKALIVAAPWYKNSMQLGLVVSLLVVTFICFSPLLSNQKKFINFDDPVYITKQDLITKMDAKHLKTMFSEHDASLNYHPLTMLSLAVNYSFSQLHPYGYFFTNLLLHLFNTFLVFLFLYRLSGKKFWTGFVAALLFGIHPMHVESVAWAAERKDVLYCFFFLACCITYLTYIETKKIKYMVFCFALFLFSCLSKAMAVPLPVVLLLIDFYRQRKFTAQSITEKIPFFLLSLVIGYIAVKVQSQGAISTLSQVTLPQRLMFASYGFMMYFEKLLVPIGLSAFYPYPLLSGGDVSFVYKIAPVIALCIAAVPLLVTYKRNKAQFRLLLFGIGFFIAMVALVLQFLSVGAAIMADRYSYLPYIGLFFIIATYANGFLEQKKTKTIAAASLVVIASLLAVTCYARVQVWQNDVVLWTDVIEKYPPVSTHDGGVTNVALAEGISIAYDNRANYYRLHGDMEKAFSDYELLTRFHSNSEGAYNNMGNLYSMKAQEAASKGNKDTATALYSKAIAMYSEAIRLKPSDIDAVHNRGITYSGMGEHQKALNDFNTALKLNPDEPSNLASAASEKIQLGMYKEGIDDYNRALAASPNDATLLFYRGTAYINSGKYKEGIDDLALSVKENPAQGNAWYNLSFAYNSIHNKQQALDAALNAKKNGYAITDQYLESLKSAN